MHKYLINVQMICCTTEYRVIKSIFSLLWFVISNAIALVKKFSVKKHKHAYHTPYVKKQFIQIFVKINDKSV